MEPGLSSPFCSYNSIRNINAKKSFLHLKHREKTSRMNSQEQPQYQGISTRITNASQPQPYSSSHAASQEQQVSSFTNYDRSPQSGQISHNQGVLGSQLSSVGKVTSGTTSTANSCQISVNQGSFTQVSSYHDSIVGNSSSCLESVHNLVDFSDGHHWTPLATYPVPTRATPDGTLFGHAPSGVYLATDCCQPCGELLLHLFTLTGTEVLRR